METKNCGNCGNWEYECICTVIGEVEGLVENNKKLKDLRKFLHDRYPTVLEEYLKLTQSPLERARDTVKQVIEAKKIAGDSKLVFKKENN